MPTKKNPKHPLLEEIDSLLDKSGKSFNSAVREYHGWCVENNKFDDDSESEAKRLEEKFKKYRSRINGSPKAKPNPIATAPRSCQRRSDLRRDEKALAKNPGANHRRKRKFRTLKSVPDCPRPQN